MENDRDYRVVRTVEELGAAIRERRKQSGFKNLDRYASSVSVGKRFLSEVERGKATAEVGKIMAVLRGLGLELAVVEHHAPTMRNLSPRPKLDFPYDWSNSSMGDDQFIYKVLEKGRFMDILRLARHVGLEKLDSAALAFAGSPNLPRLRQILDRIRAGQARVGQ